MSGFARRAVAVLADFLSRQKGFWWEFIVSEETGVPAEQGFRVAWTGGLLVAASVVLGMPETENSCPVPEPEPPAPPDEVVEPAAGKRI